MTPKTALIPLAALALAAFAAEPTPSPALLVLSKGDLMLSIVDPATRRVVARVPSGPDPHEVVASTDGTLAFISNYGGGSFNTLTVVDLVNQKVLPIVDLGPLHGPHGLVFAGGKVWFTAEGAKVIGSYDPAAKKVDWVLGTGQNRTHMIFVTEDLKHIYTSNISSATLTVIDRTGPTAMLVDSKTGQRRPGPGGPPREDWNETLVAVGRGAEGFDVSPDGRELWAANAQDGTISIVELAARKVVGTIQANVNSANRLKFTPDGRLVLVSMLSGPDLAVFDAARRSAVKRIPIGHGAEGIQMQPDGALAYVACTPDSYVALIDLKTLTVAAHLEAGKQPDGMAWAIRR